MRTACDGARNHVMRGPIREPQLYRLYQLNSCMTDDAVHLLTSMLMFDPEKRFNVDQALHHSYLTEGRQRFHSCMCTCCHTKNGQRHYTSDLDPCHEVPFDPKWEKDLSRLSMYELRDRIYKFVTDRAAMQETPLCINPKSAAYTNFTS